MVLSLPYPVSANVYWRTFMPKGHFRPIVTLSNEAIDYKQKVRWLAKRAGIRSPVQGRVRLKVDLYPQRPLDWQTRQKKLGPGWDDNVRCIDLDNCLKVLIDALKDVAFQDDRMVFEISARRMEPNGEARVVVGVEPMLPEALPQFPLFPETGETGRPQRTPEPELELPF